MEKLLDVFTNFGIPKISITTLIPTSKRNRVDDTKITKRKLDEIQSHIWKKSAVSRLQSVAFMSSLKGRLSISSSTTNMSSDIPSNCRWSFSQLGASSRTVRRSTYIARQTREDNLKRMEAHQSLLFQLQVFLRIGDITVVGIWSGKYASVWGFWKRCHRSLVWKLLSQEMA